MARTIAVELDQSDGVLEFGKMGIDLAVDRGGGA